MASKKFSQFADGGESKSSDTIVGLRGGVNTKFTDVANDSKVVHNTGTETINGAKTFSSTIVGSISGNAATVTTNADLTGPITSVGNATDITNNSIDLATKVTGILPNANTTATILNTPNSIPLRDGSGQLNADSATTATYASEIGITLDSADPITYPVFVNDSVTSFQPQKINTDFTYDATTNILSVGLVPSAVDNNLIAMDTAGKAKDSGISFTTNYLSNDNTHSMTSAATQSAISSAVTSGRSFRGGYDASTNLFPATGGSGVAGAILAGDNWVITVAGTLGGTPVLVGDTVLALINTPLQVSANWTIGTMKVDSVFGRTGAVVGQTGDYTVSQVTGAAPLASPALTGNPTAPTQSPGDNSTKLANTAYVDTGLALKSNIASPTFTGTVTVPTPSNSTDASTKGYVDTGLALKAPLASPALTGSPTAPTQSAGDNSTKLATTAYVDTGLALKSNIASPTFTGVPAAPTAGAGTSTTQLATTAFVTTADNLKANLASPTFTGIPSAPTASPGTNTTQLATTAFVAAAAAAGVTSFNSRTGAVVPDTADYSVGQITGAAPLASPTFTGTVTAPTILANTITGISGNLGLQPGASGSVVSIAASLASAIVRVGVGSTATRFEVRNSLGTFFTAVDRQVYTYNNSLDDGVNGDMLAAGSISANGNMNAGFSGGLGHFSSYPSGANTGVFNFEAANNAGNYTITLSNASHGQATTYSIPDVGAATGQILNKTAAFVSGNVIAASGTGGVTVDGAVAANKILTSGITTPDVGANLVTFSVTVTASALNAGQVTLYTSSGSKQYRIISLQMSGFGTNFSGGTLNRDGQIWDGTTTYSLIPAANLQALTNSGWGVTALPYPAAAALSTSTVAGQSLKIRYLNGGTNYTAGSVVISGLLERVA